MSSTAEDNFNKLITKAMKQMSSVKGMPSDIKELAKEGEKQSKKGFDFFKKWFKDLEFDDKSVIAGEIEHFTRQRKRTVQSMLGFNYEQKELKTFNQLSEATTKGVTFSFGRFNPPTVGHVKLATKMKSVSKGHDVKIYTSHTTGDAKNPLTNAQIRKFMNPMLPRGINVSDTKARTIFDVVVDLYNDGYKMIQMVVGSDRIQEFDKLLNKYNGVKARHGYYNFKSIKVISAGERDPDAEGAAGMSASKMRQFVHADQEKEFLAALPRGYKLGKQLYKAVQSGMGITEMFPDFMYEIYDPSVHEWGTEEGREYAQSFTPGQNIIDYSKLDRNRNEEELPKNVLAYKEKMYKELKKERDKFKEKYGKRHDEVMHGTAMQMAKRKYGYDS
jgi:hypothetical protein